eukprot:63250-Chlamydomonas_euryale.AAC.1
MAAASLPPPVRRRPRRGRLCRPHGTGCGRWMRRTARRRCCHSCRDSWAGRAARRRASARSWDGLRHSCRATTSCRAF